jgi:rod shape-determining protein MreC
MSQSPADYRWFLALSMAGVGLGLAPAKVASLWRAGVRDALRPGQALVDVAAARVKTALDAFPMRRGGLSEETRALKARLAAAEQRNRRLEIRWESLERRLRTGEELAGDIPSGESRASLFVPQLVEARVLGETSGSLWRARKLVGAGAVSGIVESSIVLNDDRPLVDQGGDAHVSPGDAVYSGRCVVGKIIEAGSYSSTLQLVTDDGYSGRARLARRTTSGLVFGSEGTLIGVGESLCRLKRIHEPVNVGDEVFTGGTDGVLPCAMYYGRVVRAKLEPGATEWSIDVKPAAALDRLESVQILRLAINTGRLLAD